MMQFSAQALYLVLVAALAFALGLNDVHTAQNRILFQLQNRLFL
jgi:hypothetical protein